MLTEFFIIFNINLEENILEENLVAALMDSTKILHMVVKGEPNKILHHGEHLSRQHISIQ